MTRLDIATMLAKIDWSANYARQANCVERLCRNGYDRNEAEGIAERIYTRMRHQMKRYLKRHGYLDAR